MPPLHSCGQVSPWFATGRRAQMRLIRSWFFKRLSADRERVGTGPVDYVLAPGIWLNAGRGTGLKPF